MPAKWKRGNFKPELVLNRIASVRTKNPSGEGSSFSGWDLRQSLPVLHSMIQFPDAARDLDHARLIWRAVAYDPGPLSKDSFIAELNRQLTLELSHREEVFHVLTSISLDNRVALGPCTIEGVGLRFLSANFPRKFSGHRAEHIRHSRLPGASGEDPPAHTRVVATLKAKNAGAAFNAALRAIDLHRSLWCLLTNSEMEIMGRSWMPINKVRLGPIHTVHKATGEVATNEMWFEPHYVLTDAVNPNQASTMRRHVQSVLARIGRCPYREDIVDALLMYVRALDEWNQTTAFMRLWSALERLTSPDFAVYDNVVRRCAFLWDDTAFAAQTLEHLRDFRHRCVHTGSGSEQAKTYCYQLQQHFRPLVRFHIGNSGRLATLEEANRFLDLPPSELELKKLSDAVRRARQFRAPKPRA